MVLNPKIHNLIVSVAIFILFFTSSVLMLNYHPPEWYLLDEMGDICHKPWQLLSGEKAMTDKTLLPILIFGLFQNLFGLSEYAPRYFSIALTSAIMPLLYFGITEIFSKRIALISLALILATHPIILSSSIATTLSSTLWFPILTFWILSKKVLRHKELYLSLAILGSLFSYAAGMLVSISMIFSYYILNFSEIRRLNYKLTLAYLTASASLFMLTRKLIYGNIQISNWGIDQTNFTPSIEGIKIILREIFISANSWYALAGEAPSIGLEVTLIVSIFALDKLFHMNTGTKESPNKYSQPTNWIAIITCTSIITILLCSSNLRLIGLRRVLPLVPFILIALVAGLYRNLPKKFKNAQFYSIGLLWFIFAIHRAYIHIPNAIQVEGISPAKMDILNTYNTLLSKTRNIIGPSRIYIDSKIQILDSLSCSLYFTKNQKSEIHIVELTDLEQIKKLMLEPNTLIVGSPYDEIQSQILNHALVQDISTQQIENIDSNFSYFIFSNI